VESATTTVDALENPFVHPTINTTNPAINAEAPMVTPASTPAVHVLLPVGVVISAVAEAVVDDEPVDDDEDNEPLPRPPLEDEEETESTDEPDVENPDELDSTESPVEDDDEDDDEKPTKTTKGGSNCSVPHDAPVQPALQMHVSEGWSNIPCIHGLVSHLGPTNDKPDGKTVHRHVDPNAIELILHTLVEQNGSPIHGNRHVHVLIFPVIVNTPPF